MPSSSSDYKPNESYLLVSEIRLDDVLELAARADEGVAPEESRSHVPQSFFNVFNRFDVFHQPLCAGVARVRKPILPAVGAFKKSNSFLGDDADTTQPRTERPDAIKSPKQIADAIDGIRKDWQRHEGDD